MLLEAGGSAGIFVSSADLQTKRQIDDIEFYDVEGDLLGVNWIDRSDVCHVAMDRGLLNTKDPASRKKWCAMRRARCCGETEQNRLMRRRPAEGGQT